MENGGQMITEVGRLQANVTRMEHDGASCPSPVVQAVDDLAREFRCSICLCLMTPPVARLPCCHYFCMSCITESIRHKHACAVCKAKATRRDIAPDPTMDRVVSKFAAVEEYKNELVESVSRAVMTTDGGARGWCAGGALLPWVQGVGNDEYQSPSHSFSGTALEELRKKEARSPSPCSKRKSNEQKGADASVEVWNNKKDDALPSQQEDVGKQTQSLASQPSKQKSIKQWLESVSTTVKKAKTQAERQREYNSTQGIPESPDFVFASQAGDGPRVDDILAGLEVGTQVMPTQTPDHHGLPSLAVPATIRSIGSGSQRNSVDMYRKTDSQCSKENAGSNNGEKKVSSGKACTPQAGGATRTVKRARTSRRAIEATIKTPVERSNPSSARRIPTRLLPWGCMVCTFENKGSSLSCEMCGQSKNSDAPSPEAVEAQKKAETSVKKKASTKRKRNKEEKVADESHTLSATPASAAGSPDALPIAVDDQVFGNKKLQKNPAQAKLTTKKKKQGDGKKVESRLGKSKTLIEKKAIDNCAKSSNILERFEDMVLTASGLETADRELLKSFCEKRGCQYVREWDTSITHVVCPDERKEPKKTFKYLMGILTGKHIVSVDWLEKCDSNNSWMPESEFSLNPLEKGNQSKVLKGYKIQIKGTSLASPVEELIKAAGGFVARKMSKDEKFMVLVLDQQTSTDGKEVVKEAWYGKALGAGVPVVTQSWLSDSIVKGRVSDVEEFTI
eukprot:jgi/Picsp_1/5643/NSC_03002-R1_protein breast cancer susceptibility 1 homolog